MQHRQHVSGWKFEWYKCSLWFTILYFLQHVWHINSSSMKTCVGSAWSFGFYIPAWQRPITSDFEGFLYQILSITLFSYLNSWERASMVWRSPWLGIEPGPPALEASTLPVDYRGGGIVMLIILTIIPL